MIREIVNKKRATNKTDKEIQKKKEQFMDQNNATRLQKLNSELAAVNKILIEDFELMMDRDKNLNSSTLFCALHQRKRK